MVRPLSSALLPLLLALLPSCWGVAFAQSPPVDVESLATAEAEKIGVEVESYLDDIKRAISLAERGEFGRFKRADLNELRRNGARIRELLTGRSDARELSVHHRVELYNAQSAFNALLQHQRKTAMVCEQVARPGSRVASTRCMTVEQRERERLSARETAEQIIRQPSCVSGEGGDGTC